VLAVRGVENQESTVRAGPESHRYDWVVANRTLPLSSDEFLARVRRGGPATDDDVSVTRDGRRLDSREAVLAWLAEVEADRAAGRFVDLDGD
jgi:hypothetical protein